MDKNIYIELANTLDSAGLFRESDDLMEVISSNASMIKTAQTSELDKAIDKYSSLEAFHSFRSLTTLIASLVASVIPGARWRNAVIEIDNKFKKVEEKYAGQERIPKKLSI